MSGKLKVGALVFVLLGVAALLLLQQQQIRRLVAENADLRTQLSEIVSLQDTCGVPRSFRELSPMGFGMNREGARRC
jgi:hypothetical protein